MSTTKAVPKGWTKVGQDGELALYASPDREQGVIFNEQSQETTGKPQPLQVFFKWGNFVEA